MRPHEFAPARPIIRILSRRRRAHANSHTKGRHHTAYDRYGNGPTVILVAGASARKFEEVEELAELAEALRGHQLRPPRAR